VISGTIAIFDRTSIMRAKADLLEKNTKMIDYLKEVREEIGDATDKYDAQKDEVIKELRTQSEFFEKLTDLFSDPEFQAQTRTMRASSQVLELLISTHGYEESIVDDIYKYAKFNYDIGNYELALEWLGRFIQLAPQNHSHSLDAVWGRLAAAICSEQFEVAHEAMVQVE
jgi:translation initiation factor 3 subunit E